MKTKCMSCGGSMKKMAVGGTTTKRIIKKSTGGMYGIPQENLGTSGQYGFAKKGGAIKKLQDGGTGMSKLEQKLRKAAGYTISDNSSGPMNSTVAQKTKKNGTTKFVEVTNIPGGGSSRQTSKTNKAKSIDNYKYVAKDKNGKVIDKTVDTIKKGQETAKKGIYFSKGGMVKKNGAVKNAKFAALAPPYDKATFADKIVGAKKSAGSKKLPKAQLGAIIKGVSKISKFFGPAAGATGKSSKIIKPAAKAVKKIKNPRMNSNSDYLKWQAKQIGAGAILAIPPYLSLIGAANYYKNKDNKNRNAVNKNKVKVNTNKIKVKTKKK